MNIEDLKTFCGPDLERVNRRIHAALDSDIDLLNMTNRSILSHSGKQMRPLLALLTARACAGEVSEDTCRFAAATELLHNATLLHDDVADDSDERRGAPTLNSLMGPSVSVLVGDYWLVKAMGEILDATRHGSRIIRVFAQTLGNLAEGEMLQLQKADSGDTDEEDYLRIIFNKTASLFQAAAISAAVSVNADETVEKAMASYSYALGIAFQIKDDIFDYAVNPKVGKPVGVDIRERKITMPLLGAFLQSSKEEEEKVRRWVCDMDSHPENADVIIDYVRKNGGIEYASKRLDDFIGQAVSALDVLPPSQARNYLEQMARYVAERKL